MFFLHIYGVDREREMMLLWAKEQSPWIQVIS